VELKETSDYHSVKYRGGICHQNPCKEAVWLKGFVKEIRGHNIESLTIMANNQGAIALAKDNKFHARTKHIDLQYHFICEAVENKKVEIKYIPMSENIADIFTSH
jgi:hypothetical protein